MTLTESGLKSIKTVMAIIEYYLNIIHEEWLSDPDGPPGLFRETQTANQLDFDLFKVLDQLDFVCDLANRLLFTK